MKRPVMHGGETPGCCAPPTSWPSRCAPPSDLIGLPTAPPPPLSLPSLLRPCAALHLQLSALLSELGALPPGSKAVVFSQWGRLLRLAGAALSAHGVRHASLLGSTPEARQQELHGFLHDPDVTVLLLLMSQGSGAAGGVGALGWAHVREEGMCHCGTGRTGVNIKHWSLWILTWVLPAGHRAAPWPGPASTYAPTSQVLLNGPWPR